jgi:hypothetical protein
MYLTVNITSTGREHGISDLQKTLFAYKEAPEISCCEETPIRGAAPWLAFRGGVIILATNGESRKMIEGGR